MHAPSFFASVGTLAVLITGVSAHMEMSQPYAIRSKYDPVNKGSGNAKVDYSMTAPLQSTGADFPCKGYQNDRPFHTVANYKAGSQQQLKLSGSATHDGGSCQVALSYDNGKTFKVIKSMIGGCPLTSEYDFTIPSSAPNGTALLSWSWNNEVGNREFYMNCAWVNIESSTPPPSQHRRRHVKDVERRDGGSFDSLPNIWVSNLPQVNDCTDPSGKDPVYPNPGPDVQYGKGMSASSSKADSKCEVSKAGPTYKQMDTAAGAGSENGASSGGSSGGPSGGASGDSSGGSGGNNGQYTPAASQAAALATPQGSSTSATGATAAAEISKATASTAGPTNSTMTSAATPAAFPSPAATSPVFSPAAVVSPAASPVAASPTQASPAVNSPAASPGSNNSSGGSCSQEGALLCLRGGAGFAVCDHGSWDDMGPVAAGTTCTGNGVIQAAGGGSAAAGSPSMRRRAF